MRTYILATVGTSMLTSLQRHLGLEGDDMPQVQEAVSWLRGHEPTDRACGAEINSIAHLLDDRELSAGTVKAPVVLQLLVSDTDAGEWTGQTLKLYLRKLSGVENVRWERVQGLDGADPDRFEREGLRQLVRQAATHLEHARTDAPGCLRLIDATGGYKAQISFAGLIGQVLKVPVVYLFEQFPRCIEMPPLPVSFDRMVWVEHRRLLEKLSDEMQMPARELRGYYVAPPIEALLDREEIDGKEYVALSPILELMHQGFSLVPPENVEPPPDCDLEPPDKLYITQKETSHEPNGTDQCRKRLAQLPWVKRVENIRFINTPTRSRIKPGGVQAVNQILVVHGDGDMGVEIRLTTTCATTAEREWCLEELLDIMT